MDLMRHYIIGSLIIISLRGYISSVVTKTIDLYEFKLPEDLKPERYYLQLNANPRSNSPALWGKVQIQVLCTKTTHIIELHKENLSIRKDKTKIKSFEDPAKTTGIVNQDYDENTHLYTIFLKGYLEAEERYIIEIEYEKIDKNVENFAGYSVLQNSKSKNAEKIVISVMENFGARRVFPCFDQRGFKSKFTIQLKHPKGWRAFSNAKSPPSKSINDPKLPEWVMDQFEETVEMETSAVTIGLIDLEPKVLNDHELKTEFRVWADKSIVNQLEYINGILSGIFHLFSEFFDIPYALEKFDLVIFPKDIYDAVESYGLVYVSEKGVMMNSDVTASDIDQYKMLSTLCHFISKQWIGYYVTMTNWSDDWLRIGINYFLQTECANQMLKMQEHDEHVFYEVGIIETFYRVLESSKKCKFDQIYRYRLRGTNIADFITNYEYDVELTIIKAYHLIRMLNFIMSPKIFQLSLHNYLNKAQFGYSNLDQLWDVLTTTIENDEPEFLPSDMNFKKIMEPWLNFDGYPLVTVTRDYKNNYITIKQEYYSSAYVKDPYTSEYITYSQYTGLNLKCWIIPIRLMQEKDTKVEYVSTSQWLTCSRDSISIITKLTEEDWLVLDLKLNVLGRVNYDEHNWLQIQKVFLREDVNVVFDVFTRTRLISDMFELAGAGKLSFSIVLDTLKYLTREKHYAIWNLVLNQFSKMRIRLFRTVLLKPFERYVRKILEPLSQNDEYHNMDEFTKKNYLNYRLKTIIIKSSCEFGVKNCRLQSQQLMEHWKNESADKKGIPSQVQDAVRCQAVKSGDKKYSKLWWERLNFKQPIVGSDISKALTCSSHKSIIKKLLNSAMDRILFMKDTFRSLCFNEKAYKILIKFFEKHFDRIYAQYTFLDPVQKVTSVVQDYLNFLLTVTSQPDDYKQLMKVAKSKGLLDTPIDILDEMKKEVWKNISWLEKSEKSLKQYFKIGVWSRLSWAEN